MYWKDCNRWHLSAFAAVFLLNLRAYKQNKGECFASISFFVTMLKMIERSIAVSGVSLWRKQKIVYWCSDSWVYDCSWWRFIRDLILGIHPPLLFLHQILCFVHLFFNHYVSY